MNERKTNQELSDLKADMVKYALEIGQIFKVKLDFTDDSIKDVEKILSEIHDDYAKTQNDEGLNGIAIQFGFYIMETIEKNHREAWFERNHKDFGDNSFPFYWNEMTLFPVSWCQKRIFDGPDDNIWPKYKIIVIEKRTE